MMRAAMLALLSLAAPAAADEIVIGLSQDRISISTNFTGSKILVFGAIRSSASIPEEIPLDVIVAVAGPAREVTVRRKERVAGIWINTQAAEVAQAPTFYAVASTRPLDAILAPEEDRRRRISIPRVVRTASAAADGTSGRFADALIRIRKRRGLYQSNPEAVELTEQTLFQTTINLPADLTEGNYTTRIFLVRGGAVIDEVETVIAAGKVGLELWLFTLAHERPLLYGLLSLVIAVGAGWGASAAFRYFRTG